MRLFSRPSLRVVCAAAALFTAAACSDDKDNPIEPVTPVPAGLAGAAASPTSATITWSAVPNATLYLLERAAGASGGSFARIATPTGTSHTDTGLEVGATYRYRVAAIVGSDTSDFSTPVTIGTTAIVRLTGNITASRTLDADTIYQLRGIVLVLNGATLTIEPGTRIIGMPKDSTAARVSALVIMRGAKIVANGTATNPIVMTSANAAGDRYPGDWGGLVIVGQASSNRTGRVTVEGPSPVDTIQWTGGSTDNDSSGVLRYVRVEFAGAAAVQDAELNSLSMYAVGNRTKVEYVQTIAGLDDAFEWFGGTVDGRYLVSYETGDDHFDWSEGYRGRNQFLIALATARLTPRGDLPGAFSAEPNGFEGDGCGSTSGTCAAGYGSTPFSMPMFANFTVIGPRLGNLFAQRPNGDGGVGAVIRRGTGGVLVNGIVAGWPERCVSIFDAATNTRLTDDSLDVRNVLCVSNGQFYSATQDTMTFDAVGASNRFGQATALGARGIVGAPAGTSVASLFTALSPAGSAPTVATLNWMPASGSLAATTAGSGAFNARISARAQNFFGSQVEATSYVGAVAPGATAPWYAGWTAYYRN